MQISHNNSPNFNAKIKFIDTKKFMDGSFRNYFYCARPKEPLANSMIVGESFWTSEVKSCTSGGVVGKEGTLGFHLFDCELNVKKAIDSFMATVKEKIKEPMSAIVLGSKDIPSAPSSVPLFEAVEKQTKDIVTPSVFKTYAKKYSEADIAYERATDTWFINAISLENPMLPFNRAEIQTVDDLKSMFKHIKIAPQDRLFIDEKEVLRADYPELFV